MKKDEKVTQAAALKYGPEKNAPEVVALGKGTVGEKIIEAATQSGVPIYNNPELAESLNNLNIGAEIPPELYEMVAQILIFIAELDNSKRRLYE